MATPPNKVSGGLNLGAAGTNINNLSNYGALAKQLGQQLYPQRVEDPKDKWLTAFQFFSNMAAAASKPGATAIGAFGEAGATTVKTLLDERKQKRAEDLAATKMGATLIGALKPKTGTSKVIEMGPVLNADGSPKLDTTTGEPLFRFDVQDASGNVTSTYEATRKGGQTINFGGEKKFAEIFASQEGQKLSENLKLSRAAADKVPVLAQMLSFVTSPDFESGRLEELLMPMRQLGYGLGIDVDVSKLATQEAFVASAQQLVLAQVEQMKGALSDKELGFLQAQVASLGKSKRGNQLLLHLAAHQMKKAGGFDKFYATWKNSDGKRIGEQGTGPADVADMYRAWRSSEIYKQSPEQYVKSLAEKKEQEMLLAYGQDQRSLDNMGDDEYRQFMQQTVDPVTGKLSTEQGSIPLRNYVKSTLDRLYGVTLFKKIFKDYGSFGG